MIKRTYIYGAEVLRHKDGDTFEARIDMGLHQYRVESIRVRGIDTAEKNSKIAAERDHAAQALAFTAARLPVGCEVILMTAKPSLYSRIEADVYFIDKDGVQKSLAAELVKAGFQKRASY